MKAVVVYESLWGSTASVACAIAPGIAVQPVGFIVAGKYGPWHHGALDRGRGWGVELGRSMR